ncbi:hypothetical protein Pmani_034556 [Petrolisthes manimaculis]|uniref:Uncharacterized protein n=1 Tax=Petrolisthes manimaculis TaxID=1843537 RepID=A0AAE1NP40_9EUCA|nr:hypothetical protein Pmani_034556 [Petrolisthes manimaculis]
MDAVVVMVVVPFTPLTTQPLPFPHSIHPSPTPYPFPLIHPSIPYHPLPHLAHPPTNPIPPITPSILPIIPSYSSTPPTKPIPPITPSYPSPLPTHPPHQPLLAPDPIIPIRPPRPIIDLWGNEHSATVEFFTTYTLPLYRRVFHNIYPPSVTFTLPLFVNT